MLQISTEFRKGVFFIRIVGRIDNEGFLEDINQTIEQVGIKNIVLNLNELNDISLESIKHIMNYNSKILKEKKQLFICDANNIRKRLFCKIPNISNEIEAFSLI